MKIRKIICCLLLFITMIDTYAEDTVCRQGFCITVMTEAESLEYKAKRAQGSFENMRDLGHWIASWFSSSPNEEATMPFSLEELLNKNALKILVGTKEIDLLPVDCGSCDRGIVITKTPCVVRIILDNNQLILDITLSIKENKLEIENIEEVSKETYLSQASSSEQPIFDPINDLDKCGGVENEYKALIEKMHKKAQKEQATFLEQLEELKLQVPLYVDPSIKIIKVFNEQVFQLEFQLKHPKSILKNEIRGMEFAGYANVEGMVTNGRLTITRNGEKLLNVRSFPFQPLKFKDAEGVEYIITLDGEAAITDEILQPTTINLSREQLPKAYFITMDVKESSESIQNREILQERKIQQEFIEKNIPVYLSLESMETEGYRFELKFEGTPSSKASILPEIGGYKFIGYIDESNHFQRGLIKLTINQKESGIAISEVIAGHKKLEKIKFNGQIFNVILEISIAELQAIGINQKIKVFKCRMLKPERMKTRDEVYGRALRMG